MRSRVLSSFVVVATKGSITEAAKTLNISQPALTKAMQRLEEELGVKLFDRVSIGVRLTRYGEILLEHARIIENEYLHAMARISELRDGQKASLRIGAGPGWLVSILPPLIARFQVQHPDIRISLVGGVIDTLVPDLIAGDLNLICVSLDFPNRNEIVKQPLFNSRHVLVADPGHPLAAMEKVSAEALHHYSWMVLKSDYVGNERISSFFATHGLTPPDITFETTSINSLLHALKSGAHVAQIPDQMLPTAASLGLRQIAMTETIWETTAGFAYRKGTRITDPMRAFMAELQLLTKPENRPW